MTAAITGYVAGGETVGPAMARCPTGVFARVCLGRDRLFTSFAMPKTTTTAGNGGTPSRRIMKASPADANALTAEV